MKKVNIFEGISAICILVIVPIVIPFRVQAQSSDVFRCATNSANVPVTRVVAKDNVTEKDLIKYKDTFSQVLAILPRKGVFK